MRIFKSRVFLGSGKYSEQCRQALHDRLDDALDALGGLQQGPSSPPFKDDAEAACVMNMKRELRHAVRDLAAALLGHEIDIDERPNHAEAGESDRLYEYLKSKDRIK